MPIYRVTFTTSLLVECESEKDAEGIGFENLEAEIENQNSEVYSVELIESEAQLRRIERGSLPWRSWERRDEPEIEVDDILSSGEKP